MTSTEEEFSLRQAEAGDVEAISELYAAARAAAVPAMPPSVHTTAEDAAWLGDRVAEAGTEVWLAEDAAGLSGYALVTASWLTHLFVRPDATGRGVGAALLGLVQARRPGGFGLWVFESNTGARRFYERHGLVELELTDGSANEEGAPDVRMVWPGRSPLTYLRAQIDEVDADLAVLLERRAALTATVQGFKPVGGQAGRNAVREQEIAERMASWSPRLGSRRLRRIMRAVITESLEAADSAQNQNE